MKRIVSVVLAALLVGSAWAQGTFTIRRPLDGATVRENVAFRIPRNSIPDGGYLGVIVNGKFLEAALPPVEGEDFVYRLDTKARGIADGPLNVELVLYQDQGERTVVLDRSSVTLTLDNRTSIRIPEDGLRLRYRFRQGTEWIYDTRLATSVQLISRAAAQAGGRGNTQDLGLETFRLLYAVDNVFALPGGGREALIRYQGLPDRGKDYAFITTTGSTEKRKYWDYQMHPIYMRMTDVGREVFSAAPPYIPIEGTSGESARLDLYAFFPLPVLPSAPVRPGTPWNAPVLFPQVALETKDQEERFYLPIPARSELVGVEWFRGVPCAKIRTSVEQGLGELGGGIENLGQQAGRTTRVSLETIVYFALDRGAVVRWERNITQESEIRPGSQGGGGAAAGGGPTAAGTTGGGGNTNPVNFIGQPYAFSGGGYQVVFDPHVTEDGLNAFYRVFQPRAAGTGTGQPRDDDDEAEQPQTNPGFGGRQGRGGGAGIQLLRIRTQVSSDLEM